MLSNLVSFLFVAKMSLIIYHVLMSYHDFSNMLSFHRLMRVYRMGKINRCNLNTCFSFLFYMCNFFGKCFGPFIYIYGLSNEVLTMWLQNAGWTPVPQFGGWDQNGHDATNYSVVFSKARANRKQNKAGVRHSSLGSEQELISNAHRHHHHQLQHRRETQDDDPVMVTSLSLFLSTYSSMDSLVHIHLVRWSISP